MEDNYYEIIPAEEDRLPLRMRKCGDNKVQFPLHRHGHTELLYFIKGGVKVYSEGEEYLAEDGDLIVVNSNGLHRSYDNTGADYFYILIPPTLFDICGGTERYLFQNKISGDEKISDIVLEMYSRLEDRQQGYRYNVLACAYKLIAYLTENYVSEKLSRKELAVRYEKTERFDKVIEFLDKHYTEPISTASLAKMSHLSEYYFCHQFKRLVGMSVKEYINDMRIRRAGALLKDTELTVTEIAGEAGFNDVNYFCRIFKRQTGFSPSSYRNS